ncbi:MAG: tagaturonate reductase [Bacteroidetes bacterium]|jgi:tagaturonate reductase|nr:tagaturonate reductase [Bacteroidota bacterium]
MNNVPPLNQSWASYPARLPLRILQFGAGNFMRAFVDWMVDVLNEEAGFNAGVIVVKPTATGDYHALRAQDGLFHVLSRGLQDGQRLEQPRLVSCVQQIIHPYQNWEAFLATAELPSLNIITSNTTEAGIQFDESDRFEDAPPSSFPAKLTRWLYRRFQHFEGREDRGCVILPCELIARNGDQLRQAVLQYASHWGLEKGFSEWLAKSNTFCNTLVDRIVPGYPEDGEQYCRQALGCEDALLVAAEPFHLWAIERQPALEGVFPLECCATPLQIRLVDDLELIRLQKVRILNGLHTIMVAIGLVHGLSTVAQMAGHKAWGAFLKKVAREYILPTLPLSTAEGEAYLQATFERFLNPFVEHRLQSIALNSIEKFKVRVLPSLLQYEKMSGQQPDELLFVLACLLQLYKKEERPFRDDSEAARRLQAYWHHSKNSLPSMVNDILADSGLWGHDLSMFQGQTLNYLQALEGGGSGW